MSCCSFGCPKLLTCVPYRFNDIHLDQIDSPIGLIPVPPIIISEEKFPQALRILDCALFQIQKSDFFEHHFRCTRLRWLSVFVCRLQGATANRFASHPQIAIGARESAKRKGNGSSWLKCGYWVVVRNSGWLDSGKIQPHVPQRQVSQNSGQ